MNDGLDWLHDGGLGFGLYDRDGIPISMEQWNALLGNYAYKRVLRTTVTDAANPENTYDVSTVWLGLDHSFGHGPPLIFETMVFGKGSEDQDRYATETQARAGHAEMVVIVAAEMTDPVIMDATTDADEG